MPADVAAGPAAAVNDGALLSGPGRAVLSRNTAAVDRATATVDGRLARGARRTVLGRNATAVDGCLAGGARRTVLRRNATAVDWAATERSTFLTKDLTVPPAPGSGRHGAAGPTGCRPAAKSAAARAAGGVTAQTGSTRDGRRRCLGGRMAT